MCDSNKYPIREEWMEYYKILEAIRRTGATNMWGAAPYLKECCKELTEQQANDILVSWIANYAELNQRFGWQS